MLSDAKKWFKKAGFGLMIHWGLYALPGGEWGDRRTDQIGEWTQSYFRIPKAEYEKLAQAFNPILFDAEEWVLLAKAAGMRYIVITAKHCDGFAMYHSRVNRYNIVDATPFGRDVLAELAQACQKHDMKLGIYYNQDQDWHDPDGGGWTRPKLDCCGCMSWTNDWDWPDNSVKDYERYFRRKVIPQVTELLTNYGPLCLIWFDNPITLTRKQSQELYDLVRRLQPGCLINSRLGNGLGDYRSMGDNEISEQDFRDELVETPATLNDTWGYKSFDNNWKPAEEVCRIRSYLAERGVNYPLNVGPDALGRIPAPAQNILREVGKQTAI